MTGREHEQEPAPVAEHGPSAKATERAGFELANYNGYDGTRSADDARVAVDGAHHPALGLDRSVCLRDVVRLLDDNVAASATKEAEYFNRKLADVIVRAFTESSSPDREGTER